MESNEFSKANEMLLSELEFYSKLLVESLENWISLLDESSIADNLPDVMQACVVTDRKFRNRLN